MSTSIAPPSRPAVWWRATRPTYLPTSVIPGLAGALVAVGSDDVTWWLLPVTLLALLLVHAATNACNDVEDAARGVDPIDKLHNSGVFTGELMTIGAGRRLYAALFAATSVLGVVICLVQGPALLVIGALGILGGWLYTGGPRPYKYDGLGDVLIVWLMGPLMTQGAYTAITGDAFHAPAFWAGLLPGLLITAVLQANNLSDIESDRAAGVRTLAVRIGFEAARSLYVVVLALAFVAPPVLWLAGLFGPWILLPLVLLPVVGARTRQARTGASGSEQLLMLTPATAQLHLAASALLCVGVALDGAL